MTGNPVQQPFTEAGQQTEEFEAKECPDKSALSSALVPQQENGVRLTALAGVIMPARVIIAMPQNRKNKGYAHLKNYN